MEGLDRVCDGGGVEVLDDKFVGRWIDRAVWEKVRKDGVYGEGLKGVFLVSGTRRFGN